MRKMSKPVIIVEDNEKEVPWIADWLGLAGGEYEWFDPNRRLSRNAAERTRAHAQTTDGVRVDLLERIDATGCRVVLMDLELTKEHFDHTGGGLTREIKQLRPDLRVIWITSMPVEQQADFYKIDRAEEAWCKPWTVDLDLRAGVGRLHDPILAERLRSHISRTR